MSKRLRLSVVLGCLTLAGAGAPGLAEKACTPISPSTNCWEVNNPNVTQRRARFSMISAMAMAAEGYSLWTPPPGDWVKSLTTDCATKSSVLRGDSTAGTAARPWTPFEWFEGLPDPYAECSPSGLALTFSAAAGQNWDVGSFPKDQGFEAASEAVSLIRHLQTPVVVPAFGSWDHWMTLVRVHTANRTPMIWDVDVVDLYDGFLDGPPDLKGKTNIKSAGYPLKAIDFATGRLTADGDTFNSTYYRFVGFFGHPCMGKPLADPDSCQNKGDPWFYKYVLLFDPPPGSSLLPSLPPTKYHFNQSPGVWAQGQRVTPRQAAAVAHLALASAGMDAGEANRRALTSGQAGEAVLVDGVKASGEPWRYFAVPWRQPDGTLSAIALLSEADGHAQMLAAFDPPVKVGPVDIDYARTEAVKLLEDGELLGEITIRWDPAAGVSGARSPIRPYYAVDVVDGSGSHRGVVLVSWLGGFLLGRFAALPGQPLQPSKPRLP